MFKLITQEELGSRLENIEKSLERIYKVDLEHRMGRARISSLTPTEPFLEEEKLHAVMERVMESNYNVPVIVLEYRDQLYIIDGHHRAYSRYVLGKEWIDAAIIEFPENKEYRMVEEADLGAMEIRSVKGEKVDGGMWRKAGQTALYFERIHSVEFSVVDKDVEVKNLVPTQPYVDASKVQDFEDRNVPILCIEQEGSLYVVDGHNRAFLANNQGMRTMPALILVPQQDVDFGIAETAERWKLGSLDDLRVRS